MKLIKTASGKQTIRLSKKDWIEIGSKANWIKTANAVNSILNYVKSDILNIVGKSIAKNTQPVIDYLEAPDPDKGRVIVQGILKFVTTSITVSGNPEWAAVAGTAIQQMGPYISDVVQKYFIMGRIPDKIADFAGKLRSYDLPDELNPVIDKVYADHDRTTAINILSILQAIKDDQKKLEAEIKLINK